ncbi:MAG: ATP-binding protein [Bacteroidales bacterium]|nr:ATP-binding protein [Bacteroidales bacterium]
MKLKKIAITGPESTGKSQLAKELAAHYQTIWLPEYARKYIEKLERPYNYDDILVIAREQKKREEALLMSSNDYLFCDTELIVTKIWCEFKYQKCHPWIIDNIPRQNYDLYLLTDIDLPWQPDPQREHPLKRIELFNLYMLELKSRNLPFGIISGVGDQRLSNALAFIKNYF